MQDLLSFDLAYNEAIPDDVLSLTMCMYTSQMSASVKKLNIVTSCLIFNLTVDLCIHMHVHATMYTVHQLYIIIYV